MQLTVSRRNGDGRLSGRVMYWQPPQWCCTLNRLFSRQGVVAGTWRTMFRQEVCMQPTGTQQVQHYKALVEHFIRLSWNTGKFNLLQQLVTPDYVYHTSFVEGFKDFAAFSDYVKEIRNAIPDLDVSIEELMVEGDKAISVSTFSGTFEKPIFGMQPNHRIVSFGGISV